MTPHIPEQLSTRIDWRPFATMSNNDAARTAGGCQTMLHVRVAPLRQKVQGLVNRMVIALGTWPLRGHRELRTERAALTRIGKLIAL